VEILRSLKVSNKRFTADSADEADDKEDEKPPRLQDTKKNVQVSIELIWKKCGVSPVSRDVPIYNLKVEL